MHSLMKDWFCNNCGCFFDLTDKQKDMTLDLIKCSNCNSKSVFNGNFISHAKLVNMSTVEIREICKLYNKMSPDTKQVPMVIKKLESMFY